jgi:phage recombination protein Bet
MGSNAVATIDSGGVVVQADFTAQQIDLIKQTVMRGASDLEFNTFINVCKAKRLDPLTRQIYAIKPHSGAWQIFASIDGLRVIAERTGKYGGQTEPYWCGPDGEWRDVWLENEPPSAAKVGVWKQGYDHPTWGVATFKSYGTGKKSNWLSMPDVMLAKCAEALALRKAFPHDLSGLYVREEFVDQETGEITDAPVAREKAPQRTQPQSNGAKVIEPTPIAAGNKATKGQINRIVALFDELEYPNDQRRPTLAQLVSQPDPTKLTKGQADKVIAALEMELDTKEMKAAGYEGGDAIEVEVIDANEIDWDAAKPEGMSQSDWDELMDPAAAGGGRDWTTS